MPIYEYETPTGEVIECIRPVNSPDIVGLKRLRVPSRVTVVTCPAPSPLDMKAGILKGFRKIEEKQTVHSEFTPQQIKSAWAT